MAADDEVVTRALSRDVDAAARRRDDGADHAGQRSRPHQAQHLRRRAAWPRSTPRSTTRIRRDDVTSIGITGKPFILAVGADLTGVPRIARREEALTIAQLGHGVMRKLRDGGKPSFCFVNGAALGGGLELALHCDYRTVLDSVTAIAFPEVFLGIVPGWGGAFLLPNLVGAEQAVKVIVENALNQNTMLNGPQGLRPRDRGRDVRRRGLPRAVPAVGGRVLTGDVDGTARRGRPRRRLGRRRDRGPGRRRRPAARRRTCAVPRPGADRRGADRRPRHRRSPPRTRRWPT